jgi:hypothetical protein
VIASYIVDIFLNREADSKLREASTYLSMADSSSEGNTRAVSSMFRVGRFVQQGVENLVTRTCRCVAV